MPLYGYPDGLSYGFHRIWPSGPIRVYGKRHGNPERGVSRDIVVSLSVCSRANELTRVSCGSNDSRKANLMMHVVPVR